MRGLRLPLTQGRLFVLLALLVLLAQVGVPMARAQDVSLAPSEAVACLTPPPAERGEPDYPLMAYKAGKGGRVVARVLFQDKAWLPRIDIVEETGGDEFTDAVKSHLRKLRVPCLPAGGSATLQFEYSFNPERGDVNWLEPEDLADGGRRALLGCVTGGPPAPIYPDEARRQSLQGRLWAKLRYTAADRPPEVQLFHRPGQELLAQAARQWLEARRMPCHQGGPVNAEVAFVFRLGDDVYGFKSMTLLQLMRSVQGIRKRPLQLDTREMGCPFRLKFTYRQPDAPNRIGQLDDPHAGRRPLLDWLRGVQLDLPQRTLDAVYADTADIEVPCLKIALTPQEKPT